MALRPRVTGPYNVLNGLFQLLRLNYRAAEEEQGHIDEAILQIAMSTDSHWCQGGGSGHGERWSDSSYILKVRQTQLHIRTHVCPV